jgi:hypothetical protein
MPPAKTQYRVKIVVYDNVNTTPDNPEFTEDEPFYGEDELVMMAHRIGRNIRRHIETEQ